MSEDLGAEAIRRLWEVSQRAQERKGRPADEVLDELLDRFNDLMQLSASDMVHVRRLFMRLKSRDLVRRRDRGED
jgi:hypothetical protein